MPSSASSTPVDRNVTSGWFSASKNSAPSTWARNCSGLRIEIDSTRAAPSSERPSSPALSVARHVVERAAELAGAGVLDAKPKDE